MKKVNAILLVVFLLFAMRAVAQNYNFNGSMTRAQLESYMSRAITMQGLTDEISCYFPPCNAPTTYNPSAHAASVNMLADLNARFIGRSCGLWGSEWSIGYGYFTNVGTMVSNITNRYSQAGLVKPIIQAGMFEYVTNSVNQVQISQAVATAYNEPIRNFNFDNMKYSDFPSNATHQTMWNNTNEIVPDISKKETQMWFYFLATNYIDRGIEALHFGQAEIMDDNDPNHIHYWDLLSKIRAYAATKNRGLVLCDAHTKGLYYNNTNQLLFDLHAYPLRVKEVPGTNWGTGTGGAAVLDYNYCNAIYGLSKGGRTFFGWECTSLPYLVEFDNFGIGNNPNNTGAVCIPWGWDEITWFGLQTETYRNNWLKYAHYKVKCLDPVGFLEMPGIRGMTELGVPWPGHIYRAATGYYNQQVTIKNIWNNTYAGPTNWIHHNFTNEQVVNQPSTPNVASSLVFSGNDRMYYIGTDGYIHGYIKDNGLSGWHTVSPSYSAQIYGGVNMASQVKAQSDLTVSPDGSLILYIGIDGYIHGFNTVSVWNYTYLDFVKSPMISQSLRAQSGLQFVSNSRIYYIAKESNGTGNARVHGFIKSSGNWVTVSPTYASQVPATSMMQAAGALAFNPSNNRIYYVGTDGFLYYYTILTDWTYNYVSVPQSQLISQNLRIMPNKIAVSGNKIFYIGKELANGNALRIHAMIDNSGAWSTVSPSWSAHFYNGQPINTQTQSNGLEIACNSAQQRIAYVGTDGKVYVYQDINAGWNFSYNTTYGASGIPASNSLRFTDDGTLYYNSTATGDKKVHYVSYQESYCQNGAIAAIEPGFTYTRMAGPGDQPLSANAYYSDKQLLERPQGGQGFQIKMHPNPASTLIQVEIVGAGESSEVVFVVRNAMGVLIARGELDASTNHTFDVSAWPAGVYFVEFIRQGIPAQPQKVIIQR